MEGVIRFGLEWDEGPLDHCNEIGELDELRNRLYGEEFLGVGPDGVGQGNVSRILTRDRDGFTFLITGSGTGAFPLLTPNHYVKVTGYDFDEFRLRAKGPLKPSSESLSHCALYELDSEISWVIHIHSMALWEFMSRTGYLSTDRALYGTREMVEELQGLYRDRSREWILSHNTVVMKNHEGGILSFGRDAAEAEKAIMDVKRKSEEDV